jgi:hypothetical protein
MFRPEFLVGIYQWPRPAGDVTYLRFAFGGELTGFEPERSLDAGIVRAVWMTLDELRDAGASSQPADPAVLRGLPRRAGVIRWI